MPVILILLVLFDVLRKHELPEEPPEHQHPHHPRVGVIEDLN